jgi:hypothetical protein
VAKAIVRFYAEGSVDRFQEGIRAEKERFSWEALARTLIEKEEVAWF